MNILPGQLALLNQIQMNKEQLAKTQQNNFPLAQAIEYQTCIVLFWR